LPPQFFFLAVDGSRVSWYKVAFKPFIYLGKNALLVFVMVPVSRAILGYGPTLSSPLIYYEFPGNNMANWLYKTTLEKEIAREGSNVIWGIGSAILWTGIAAFACKKKWIWNI